jgi:hypothetical protein
VNWLRFGLEQFVPAATLPRILQCLPRSWARPSIPEAVEAGPPENSLGDSGVLNGGVYGTRTNSVCD